MFRKKVKWIISVFLAAVLCLTGIGQASAADTTQDLISNIFNQVGLKSPSYQPSPPTQPKAQPPAKPNPQPQPQPESPAPEPSSTLADKIIQTGEKYLGTPYQYGAKSGQTKTFDCSSFTQYIFGVNGIKLPRTSRQQATVGTYVPRSQIQKGDLLFFRTSSSGQSIGHVAVYAGDNKVLHTWGPGGVRYDSLSTKWLDKGYVTARRVIQ